MEIYRKNAQGHFLGQHFVGARAVERHVDISQQPFCMEIENKNGGGHLCRHHFVRTCAVKMRMGMPFGKLVQWNAHGHVTKGI